MKSKSQKTFRIIPALISTFKDYDKNLKNRVKIDSILSCFNDNASQNFTKFINLSNNRYQSVKNGAKLNQILKNQRSKYNDLNNLIQNDVIYKSDDVIISEKKKLDQSVNIIKNKKISKLREKLLATVRIPHVTCLKKIPVVKMEKSNKSDNIPLSKKQITEAKKEVENFVTLDNTNLNDKLFYYKKLVNYIGKIYNEESLDKKLDKNFFKNAENYIDLLKSQFNENNIKLLSYKYCPKFFKKKENDLHFDLLKVNKIKNVHFKNKIKKNFSANDLFYSTINNNRYTNFKNPKDTFQIVKNEAGKNLVIDQNFENIENSINNCINSKILTLGQIDREVYSYFQKLGQNKKSSKNLEVKIIKDDYDDNDNLKKIKNEFKEIYEKKKKEWKNEEELYEKQKDFANKKNQEIINFIHAIEKIKK